MTTTARADLQVRGPGEEDAWVLLPHVVGRARQAVIATEGRITDRAAAGGVAVFTVRVEEQPASVVIGYAPEPGVLVVRVEVESPFPVRLAALVFPTVLLISLLSAWTLGGTAAAIAIGFLVGMVLSTLVSWWTWALARRRGASGAGAHRSTMQRLRSAQLSALRGAGLEVVEAPSRLLGLEEEGTVATTGESVEEALRLGDPAAWTARMAEALGALP